MDKVKLEELENFFAAVKLPQTLLVGPGETISDLAKFLESHFTALKNNCPAILAAPYGVRLLKVRAALVSKE